MRYSPLHHKGTGRALPTDRRPRSSRLRRWRIWPEGSPGLGRVFAGKTIGRAMVLAREEFEFQGMEAGTKLEYKEVEP